MKKTLKWRLSKLPTPEELVELVKNKIITQNEAKEILLTSETQEEEDVESLKSEVKFLRDLIKQMARTRASVVESIRYIEAPRKIYPWYEDTKIWCSTLGDNTAGDFGIRGTYTSGTQDTNLLS